MSRDRQIGVDCYNEVKRNSEQCELTSVVFAAEQLLGGWDRIELRPRVNFRNEAPKCYTRQLELDGNVISLHYIFYSDGTGHAAKASRRLHCAHELGHIILHNKTLRKGERLTERHEIEANWFALCLLQMHGYVDKHGRWRFPKAPQHKKR